MHVARRDLTFGDCAAARRQSREPVWFRLRTREWDFYVTDEVEAFAVLARHDVETVEQLTVN